MIDVLSNVFYFKKTCTPGNKFIQSLTISDYIYLNPPELDISIKKSDMSMLLFLDKDIKYNEKLISMLLINLLNYTYNDVIDNSEL